MEKIIEAIAKAKASSSRRLPHRPVNAGPFRADAVARDDSFYSRFDRVDLDGAHLENNRIIAYEQNDPKTVVYDMLRTQVMQQMTANKWQTLVVTSPTAGCGKTVTAINLAFSMARQEGQVVVLVDLDLRKPDVGNCLGIVQERSLFDYLHDDVELADILIKADDSRLFVLANNRPIKNASEIIASPKASELIANLHGLFPTGIFVFDLPPMLVTDDVIAFFPQVDCTLLLAASGQTTISDIEDCEAHMRSTNFLGIVLNKFEGASESYY